MSNIIDKLVSHHALAAGYSTEEIQAGLEFAARKARRNHPPGNFDRAKRFYAEERTEAVCTCRDPSRTHPYPEMGAARTAAHCAEVFGAQELLAVKRVAKMRDEMDGMKASAESAHAEIAAIREASDAAKRILKPIKRPAALAPAF